MIHYDRGKHCQSHEGVIAFKVHYCHKVAKGSKCSFLRKFLAFKTAVASRCLPNFWEEFVSKMCRGGSDQSCIVNLAKVHIQS